MRVIKSYEMYKIRDLFMGQVVVVTGSSTLMLSNGLTVKVEPWQADCWCRTGDCEITRIAGFDRPVEYTLLVNRWNKGEHTICASSRGRARLILKVEGVYGHHDTGYDLVVR